MTTLNDVKAFLADNKEVGDVQDFVKGLVGDERMLSLAMDSDKGQMFFQKQFDRKISEAKQKMETNFDIKLKDAVSNAEETWIEKHKKKETKSPTELKLEEMQGKLDAQEKMLKQRELMSALKLPEPLKQHANKLIADDWTTEDANAFSEKTSNDFNEFINKEVEKRISANKTAPGGINGANKTGGTNYSNMNDKQLAQLSDVEYKAAIAEIANSNK